METVVSEKIKNYIMKINREAPFHKHLGMKITKIEPGLCELELTVEEKHMNLMKTAHGGVAPSLLDTVSGGAARTKGYEVVTSEMNISYLNPMYKGDKVRAQGRILKAGRRIILVEGKLFRDKDDKLLAVSRLNLINQGELKI